MLFKTLKQHSLQILNPIFFIGMDFLCSVLGNCHVLFLFITLS